MLLLLLGLTTLASVAYLRGTYKLMTEPYAADALARGLDRSERLLGSAQALVHPGREALEAGYRPEIPARPPLVLRVRKPDGAFEIVGLSFDPSRRRLVQLLYPAGYDHPDQVRCLDLAPATGLEVRLTDRFELRVEAGPQQLPWSAAVPLRGVQLP